MKENEIRKAVVGELKELGIPVYYIHNQRNTPPPYVTFNYILFEDYYSNDKSVYCIALVTLNLIVSRINYDEFKRYHKILKSKGYQRAIKFYDNEAQVYFVAFQKEFLIWE